MPRFKVFMEEITTYVVIVEASTEAEAEDMAEQAFCEGHVDTLASEYQGVTEVRPE